MKFYKLILKEICLFIVIAMIGYLTMVFINAEFNPYLWSMTDRQSVSFGCLLIFAFVSIPLITDYVVSNIE